jgi:hypothetical protein
MNKDLVTGKGYEPPSLGKSGSQSHLERGPVIIPFLLLSVSYSQIICSSMTMTMTMIQRSPHILLISSSFTSIGSQPISISLMEVRATIMVRFGTSFADQFMKIL